MVSSTDGKALMVPWQKPRWESLEFSRLQNRAARTQTGVLFYFFVEASLFKKQEAGSSLETARTSKTFKNVPAFLEYFWKMDRLETSESGLFLSFQLAAKGMINVCRFALRFLCAKNCEATVVGVQCHKVA